MDTDRYLSRIGLDRSPGGDAEALRDLQVAHVRAVPFETLSITGHPFGAWEGEGVTLDPAALYRKLVGRGRGGFCYELNGLFHGLLAGLGFEVDRVAACVLGEDGTVGTPANHHSNVVTLDRRYVVDVGLARPPVQTLLPLDGTVTTDAAGLDWRVVGSDRPDADYLVQCRADGWTDRYVLTDEPRELSYFGASCDYLSTAPESTFTGDPVVTVGTAEGYKRLDPSTLAVHDGTGETERPVPPEEWDDVLETEFGLRVPSTDQDDTG